MTSPSYALKITTILIINVFFLSNLSQAENEKMAYANFCRLLSSPDLNLITTSYSNNKFNLNQPCQAEEGLFGMNEPLYPLEILINPKENYGSWEKYLSVADFLIKNGAKLDLAKPDGTTIFLSTWHDLKKNENSKAVLEFALNKGVSLKTQIQPAHRSTMRFKISHSHKDDDTGADGLMLSVSEGPERMVQTCTEASWAREGKDCLDIMAMFRTLISNSDLSLQDAYGRTALHRAVESKSYYIAKLLLEAGAKRDAKDYVGLTPIDYAISVNDGKILSLLQSNELPTLKATAAPEPTEVKNAESVQTTPPTPSPVSELKAEPVNTVSNPMFTNLFQKAFPTATPQLPNLQSALSKQKAGKLNEARLDLTTLAEKGDIAANYELGRMFAKGEGGNKDFLLARKYFEAAALGNHPQAYFALGLMYARGDGVKKDKEKAKNYLKKAVSLGSKEARGLLSDLH